MPRHLQLKMAVSALVQELASVRLFSGESA
jgi:hypothetical protein